MTTIRAGRRWGERGLILLLLLGSLASLRGDPQGGGEVGVSLCIPLHVGYTATPRVLTFPRIRARGTYVLQTPLTISTQSNTHQAQLRFQCVSPNGNLMTRVPPRREIPTFYLIAEEGSPPPDPTDPRWIPGSQLKNRIMDVDIFGERRLYLFCKVEISRIRPGVYGDIWTIKLRVQGSTYSQSATILCPVG